MPLATHPACAVPEMISGYWPRIGSPLVGRTTLLAVPTTSHFCSPLEYGLSGKCCCTSYNRSGRLPYLPRLAHVSYFRINGLRLNYMLLHVYNTIHYDT